MREQWIFAILIVILFVATILYPSAGWMVRTALLRHSEGDAVYEATLRENHALQAEISVANSLQATSTSFLNERPVSVFSRYPLNFKNEILVNSGRNQGVQVGDIAIIPTSSSTMGVSGIFVGKVVQLFTNTALVETVFDSGFESAIRIGSLGVDAFLKGGNAPHATLIQRRAGVKHGEVVYLASPNFPYGIAVGTIDEIIPSRDNVFDEATLLFGYDINHIATVHLIPANLVQ